MQKYNFLIINLGLVNFLMAIGYFFISTLIYLDPINFCKISIDEDILRGNKQTIYSAMQLLKNQDFPSYQTICKYVDSISENPCPISHAPTGVVSDAQAPGCYIKGSRIIYLIPDKHDSPDIIKQHTA